MRLMGKWIFACFLFIGFGAFSLSGQVILPDDYLVLNADGSAPLYTTYAAAMERSRFFADKAYFMDYFSPEKPLMYSSQYAGDWALFWKINNVVISQKRNFAVQPMVTASFPDLVILTYQPITGLKVQETFFVYSSGSAIIHLVIENAGAIPLTIMLYPVLHLPADSLSIQTFDGDNNGYWFNHTESLTRLHSNLYANRGYPTRFRNLLAGNTRPDSYGGYTGGKLQDFYYAIKRFSKVHEEVRSLNQLSKGPVDFIALQKNLNLQPGEKATVRFVRAVQDSRQPASELAADLQAALAADLQAFVNADVALFKAIPRLKFRHPEEKIIYLSAFNLARGCMLPASGKTAYNYYVFSRNPIWGWGHGHQVMHESLSMLAYAYLDPQSAQASQRIYMEQQYADGLIGYRHGPRGPQVYPHEGKATTSAPFFCWTNWEIYQVSKDRQFLHDAYQSGAKFIRFLESERDQDRDGLFEWGPYGIIENVRDGWNVVFQLFSEGEDEGRDISDELDALDLSTQVANEMYYLKLMAAELGDTDGLKEWSDKFGQLAERINRYMWEPQDQFYYHVAMSDNSCQFEGASLKRKEIIGFLPMWAHVASKDQAKALVRHLSNEKSFWRTYGVPTLAADDPHYTPFVDGCCRWNGPIWLLWDYMVLQGLKNYGYDKLAQELADKMLLATGTQLRKNHRFWESYSPDFPVLECPENYIWDAIMARVLIDFYDF